MAIDASILLKGGTVPDIASALHRGAEYGDALSGMMEARRNRPMMRERARLENELLQAQVARQQQMNALGMGSKVGARKIFNDGTLLQSTPAGPRVFAPGGTAPLQGEQAQQALQSAFQNEINLSGAKAQATAQGRLSEELKLQPQIKEEEVKAVDRQKRLTESIDRGLDVTSGISDIGRALELLDLVSTGKPEQALLGAKNLFGIEAADSAELNSLLGQSVVSELRPIFGGNPTEGERSALKDISAAFSQGTEVNKRLLNRGLNKIERTINRALAAAEEKKEAFSVEQLNEAKNRINEIKSREFSKVDVKKPEAKNDFDLEFDPATGTFK